MRRINNKIEKEEKIEYTYKFMVKQTTELLEFLLSKMKTSRNNIKMLLKNHQVLVNGNSVSQFNYILAKEDEVLITKKPVLVNKKLMAKKEKNILDIIYEDENYIAINKPHGLLSVASDKSNVSAYNLILDYVSQNEKNKRVFQIHRIDKETSGVLVFAKNPVIQSKLRNNWNDYVITREYVALVSGRLKEKSKRLIYNLKEDMNNMVYVSNDGDKSITNYTVIKENNNYSLLNVLIETGKKNQIRVVLKHIGNPVVGDEKYNNLDSPIKRLGLHASMLEFICPQTKKKITIKAKVPNSFYKLFEK